MSSVLSDLNNQLCALDHYCDQNLKAFKAGGLKKNYEFWAKNISDPSILSIISDLTINFSLFPDRGSVYTENRFSETDKRAISSEINSFLSQSIIEPVTQKDPDEYYSKIFCVPKKDGGSRVILNLKHLNNFVEKSHFKMNSLNTAIDLMSENCYMASVDFKSAYYSVVVRQECRKYLRFRFDGKNYQYTCLPMGLTTGPRDFTKIVKTLFKMLREKGHLSTFYIDDSFLVGKTYEECAVNVIDTVNLTQDAGFTINSEKSVLFPTTEIRFLGVILNSRITTVSLGLDKLKAIKSKIEHILRLKNFTIMCLAELVGKLVFVFCAIQYSKLYYRQLEIDKLQALRLNRFDFQKTMTLSSKSRSDLNWWLQNLSQDGIKIESKNPDFTIKTDASNFGYGGVFLSKKFCGVWSKTEVQLHINLKELLAVKYCLFHFFKAKNNCCVKVLTDNKTTMTYINSMGGKIQACHDVAKGIWEWAISRKIWLLSAFIPGKINIAADKLSRVLNENTEWSLSPKAFSIIQTKFPEVSIDLFASHLNSKLPNYCSWFPDKNAKFCDAFSIAWSGFCGYAFPPFSMIGRVLRKVELERCQLVIVVPEWKTQYWFSKLTSMCVSELTFLPRSRSTVTNPLNSRATRITSRFIVCKISGSPKTALISRTQ